MIKKDKRSKKEQIKELSGEEEEDFTMEDIDEVIEEVKEKPHSWFKERKR